MHQAEVKSIETEEIKSLKGIVSESTQDVSDAVSTRNILREKLRLVNNISSTFFCAVICVFYSPPPPARHLLVTASWEEQATSKYHKKMSRPFDS